MGLRRGVREYFPPAEEGAEAQPPGGPFGSSEGMRNRSWGGLEGPGDSDAYFAMRVTGSSPKSLTHQCRCVAERCLWSPGACRN